MAPACAWADGAICWATRGAVSSITSNAPSGNRAAPGAGRPIAAAALRCGAGDPGGCIRIVGAGVRGALTGGPAGFVGLIPEQKPTAGRCAPHPPGDQRDPLSEGMYRHAVTWP